MSAGSHPRSRTGTSPDARGRAAELAFDKSEERECLRKTGGQVEGWRDALEEWRVWMEEGAAEALLTLQSGEPIGRC